MEQGGGVCAIVVTHNRKALLEECMRAIQAQTQPVTSVLVIDNASTDGTKDLFAETGSLQVENLDYVRLETNGGGAGGFHRGMKVAMESDCDWLWLMDDDTIASPTALAELLATWRAFPERRKPEILASKVLWTDGTLHSMNFPTIKRAGVDPALATLAAENRTLWLRWASFVSVLIHRPAIEEHGLPHADYFIWNDDTEYTARILREGFGVLVPASVVIHKTAHKHSALDAAPARAFYQVRNVLWMILRSNAWARHERAKIAVIHLRWIIRYLTRMRFRSGAVRAVFAGVRDGLLKRPQA